VIVCLCRGVSDRTIAAALSDGARTAAEVAARCGAGTGCGACVPTIERLCTRACDADLRNTCGRACHADAADAESPPTSKAA
jgi:bacterioferritin-associated ferredoxin